ncbi:MAG: sulfatase-like hydrolase/transferase [Lentimonas sp.]
MRIPREIIGILRIAPFFFLSGAALVAQNRDREQPNVLVILTDQQFADVMSCAGSEWVKTPAMDSLAKKGVRFPNAYVNYPVCMPERYSMFTGRLPSTRHAADENQKPIISLGNQARKAAYDTAYFGKWHIQNETFGKDDTKFHGFNLHTGGKDKTMTKNAIQFLSEERTKPFLAVVSYYNPHDICEWGRKKAGHTERVKMANGELPIDPHIEQCPPLPDNYAINDDEAEAVAIRRTEEKKGEPNAQKIAMDFDRNDWRQYRWAYNRLVEMVDTHIGALLESLDESGHARNTVIIFTSDHGDGYGAHRWHQKSVLYEESCRVPFIVSWPGKARKNETDDRLISVGIDLMATVSDVVGTPMPEGPYYGKSALPFVFDKRSTASTHSYVITEAEVRVSTGKDIDGRSVRTPKFKYHVWSRGEDREQLFDMINDAGETKNLAADKAYATQLSGHRELLTEWLAETDDTFGK